MRMYDIIKKKRDGGILSADELAFTVRSFTHGDIPDSQMSALAMAVFFCGMNDVECAVLTGEMATSGDILDLSELGELTVDKHSTGGVGDKTTVVLAPMCASLGMKVAKMSGRGLGHTGGTVDKLESIPGFCTELSPSEFISQVKSIGCAVVGQSAALAPADKKLYRLRDECAEVESLPLIASSIMSKKLAAGSKNIVLDVKCGGGAFMKTRAEAVELAETMVKIGKAHGRSITALITDMDTPLGRAIGNSLEINEAVEVLRGGGPAELRELCCTICAVLYSMCFGKSEVEGRRLAENVLSDGSAYSTFLRWISAQGGDISVFENGGLLPTAENVLHLTAKRDGYVSDTDCEGIGRAALFLGAGRRTPKDTVDHSTGIVLKCKKGDFVCAGDILAEIYASSPADGVLAVEALEKCVHLSDNAPCCEPLILGIV